MSAAFRSPRVRALAWPLVAGALVIAGGTFLGWDAGLLDRLVALPTIVRAVLVGVSAVLAVGLLREALLRLEGSAREPEHDVPAMVRGIRFVFLSIAAFAAAGGWLIGDPLPLIVALVIAGIDVLETSFLLLVVATRRPDR